MERERVSGRERTRWEGGERTPEGGRERGGGRERERERERERKSTREGGGGGRETERERVRAAVGDVAITDHPARGLWSAGKSSWTELRRDFCGTVLLLWLLYQLAGINN